MMLRRLIVFILLTALAACSRGKQYEMRGQVLGANQEKAEVLVDHEAIEDWMPAMTMSYTVSDPALLSGLQPGDLITARVSVAPDIRVTSVTKTGSAPLKTPPPAPTVDTPEVLKGHARELGADPNVWTFVTGNRDDTDRFAMRLGLTLMRGQTADLKERAASVNQEIGHTLRRAVIDRNGTLVKVYTGNEWTPAQLVADLESLR